VIGFGRERSGGVAAAGLDKEPEEKAVIVQDPVAEPEQCLSLRNGKREVPRDLNRAVEDQRTFLDRFRLPLLEPDLVFVGGRAFACRHRIGSGERPRNQLPIRFLYSASMPRMRA